MPEIYLQTGAMVRCSVEDYELVEGARWRVWYVGGEPRVVRDLISKGQRYRLHLHREVAFAMRPELVKKASLVTVRPENGDFTDVRRENLAITVKPRARGAVRKAAGHAYKPYRGSKPSRPPPGWARAARSAEHTLHDD